MPIKINGSTSGSVTLAAPATGSDVTLTLPTLGFGKVLQVVTANYSTATTSSSNVLADTGLTASITPSSTTSRIIVIVNHNGCYKETGNTWIDMALLRGSTTIVSNLSGNAGYTNSTATNCIGSIAITYVDSPSSTSSLTYKTQFASGANVAVVGVQRSSVTSTITLIEVGP